MTLTETYEMLNRIRVLERRIRRLMIWRDELQASLLPGAVRYDTDPVQVSPEDHIGDIAARVADLDVEIKQLQRQKARLVYTIGDAIEGLDNEVEKTVLSAFYVGRMPMTDVAEIVHYGLSRTYDIRRAAVEHLGLMISEKSEGSE